MLQFFNFESKIWIEIKHMAEDFFQHKHFIQI